MSPKPLATTFILATLALAFAPARADEPIRPPAGRPCTVAARWTPQLLETPDTVNGGAPLRGLAVRVSLFQDPDLARSEVVACAGECVVDLYDDAPLARNGQPMRLERWVFPDVVLRRLIRRDAAGWGYALFLPWVTSYRPDITRIHLLVTFTPKGGGTLSERSPSFALRHASRPLALAGPAPPASAAGPNLPAEGNAAPSVHPACGRGKPGAARDGDLTRLPKPGPGMEPLGYNRRVYYVVSGSPRCVVVDRLPLTGGETVLDAIACVPRLPAVTSKCSVLLARPSRGGDGGPQILPVDWAGIAQCGEMRTNYALRPNDRIYVVPRPTELARYGCFVDPLERARGAAAVWWLSWELLTR